MFLPFTAQINCSSHLKIFANSRTSASNFKSFSRLLFRTIFSYSRSEQFWIQSVFNFLELIIPIVDGGPSEGAVHVKEGS